MICGVNSVEMGKLRDKAVWELAGSEVEWFVSNKSSWSVWTCSESDESSSSMLVLSDMVVGIDAGNFEREK